MFSSLYFTLGLSLCISLLSFIFGFFTNNLSVVDKLWSIVPMVYTWIYWVHALLKYKSIFELPLRLHVMSLLVTLWGVRLTSNFHRKGGYALEAEDYRWIHVRDFFGKNNFLFQIFHLLFIAFYQHILLWSLTLPAFAALNSNESWSYRDTLSMICFIASWLIEHIADNQQFSFQTEKQRKLKLGSSETFTQDQKRGFLSQGLFAYSRHPNFAAEQAQWVFFSTLGPSTMNHSGLPGYSYYGALALICLFQGSTWLTEKITLSRHPLYSNYQKDVPRFLPHVSSIFDILASSSSEVKSKGKKND